VGEYTKHRDDGKRNSSRIGLPGLHVRKEVDPNLRVSEEYPCGRDVPARAVDQRDVREFAGE
jgi:hypothetical protein